jgi:mannose-1-phosphate guanylyltransferase
LWGIVIRGAEDDARRHYSPSIRARVRPQRRLRRTRVAPTIEGVGRLIAPERLVMVLVRGEPTDYARDLQSLGAQHVVQPAWRGSAAEVFLAALHIAREDPHATVALLPWQHLVGHEGTMMTYVGRAAKAVDVRPDLAVVIGAPGHRHARPAAWIEPGDPVEGLEGLAIRAVSRFLRHPSPAERAALLDAGALVATRLITAKVATLLALGRARLPDVLETLEPLQAAAGPEEDLLCEAVYESMPLADVASTLAPRGDGFAVLPIPEFVELEDLSRLLLAS